MRPTRLGWIAAVSVAFLTLPAWGEVQTPGHEVRVNARTDFKQQNPVAALSANGNAIVVWENDQRGVRGQFLGANGLASGSEMTLVASEPIVGSERQTIATRREPSVAFLAGGGFLVAYTEEIDEVQSFAFIETRNIVDQDVYLQRFNASGGPVGARARVNTTTTGFQRQPRLLARGHGDLLVAWEDAAGGIYIRPLSSSGGLLGTQFRINDAAGSHPVGAATANTNLIVWEAEDGSQAGVYARLLSASGMPIGPAFRVNTATSGRQRRPAVAAASDDSFLVAWQGDLQISTQSRIFAQAIGANGNLLGPQLTLVQGVGFDVAQIAPALAAAPGGHFVLTWLGWRSASSIGFEMAAAEIDALGNTVGTPAWIAEHRVQRNFRRTSIASDGQGAYLTSWETVVNNRQSIAARRFGAD
jgi:hypothetical protein